MIPIDFNFEDLANEKKYAVLQNRFYWCDCRFDEFDIKATKPVNNFTIYFKNVNEKTQELEEYVEVDFENDFLLPKIRKLAEKNYRIFFKKISSYYIEEQKTGYSKQSLNYFRKLTKNIKDAIYLNDALKKEILEQIKKIEDRIIDYLNDPYPNIKRKISFNLGLTEVLTFFHLLRYHNITSYIEDADLGRILDEVFEFKENNKSATIKNSRKLLNNIKNGSRPISSSLKTLQDIFSKQDFYTIKF